MIFYSITNKMNNMKHGILNDTAIDILNQAYKKSVIYSEDIVEVVIDRIDLS